MGSERLNEWKIIVDTVRGPTHVRTGLPNQDDFDYASGPPITIAVSDGHGSSKCFRSDRGAGFATETAIEVAESFFEGEWERLSLQDRQQQLDVRLPNRIVSEWRAKVRRNLEDFPLSKEEQEMLASRSTASLKTNAAEVPYIVYGATLLAVVVKAEFVVYLQLGDGDILTVLDSGDVIRPLPLDERLIGNETTSLSSEKAASDFRVALVPLFAAQPRLILLATDGYSNSFKDEMSFRKAAIDFRNLLSSNDGSKEVEQHFREWLELSAQMSGDDVTLCLLCPANEDSASSELSVSDSQGAPCIEKPDVRETSALNSTGSAECKSSLTASPLQQEG
jgi:hypothetical protein